MGIYNWEKEYWKPYSNYYKKVCLINNKLPIICVMLKSCQVTYIAE